MKTAEVQGQKWSKMLQQERGHRQRLEEMVEQLAKQQRQLEQQAHRIIPSKFLFVLHCLDEFYKSYILKLNQDLYITPSLLLYINYIASVKEPWVVIDLESGVIGFSNRENLKFKEKMELGQMFVFLIGI